MHPPPTMYTYEHTNTHVYLHTGTHIREHTASSRDLPETLSGIQIISLSVAHGGGGDRVVLSPSALQRPPTHLGGRAAGPPREPLLSGPQTSMAEQSCKRILNFLTQLKSRTSQAGFQEQEWGPPQGQGLQAFWGVSSLTSFPAL